MENRKRPESVSPFDGRSDPKRSRSNGSSSHYSPNPPSERSVKVDMSPQHQHQNHQRLETVRGKRDGSVCPPRNDSAGSVASSAGEASVSSARYAFCSDMMKTMNEFREANVLCDATICVGGKTFNAHRTVLAASSPYFKALFASTLNSPTSLETADVKPVVLTDIESDYMENILQYIYTGEIELNQDNIKDIIAAANYLLVTPLKERCTAFLQKMLSPRNCLGIETTASQFDCELLKSTATSFVRDNFITVSATEEFLSLDAARLRDLVASDDTKIDREEQIYEAIMNWVKHDLDVRREYFKDLVSYVRFPLISPYYLMDHVEADEIVRSTPECIALLLEAKNYHMLPDRRWQLKSKRTTPRVSMGIVNGIIAVGGIQGPCESLFLNSVVTWYYHNYHEPFCIQVIF